MASDLNVSPALPPKKAASSCVPRVDSRQSSYTAPYQNSHSGHGHDDGYNDHYGAGDMYDDGPVNETPMTRLQVFMQRSLFGWPLYTIVIAMGQLLSAVS